MTTRKDFIKKICGATALSCVPVVAVTTENTSDIKSNDQSIYCRYVAAKYVDQAIGGPFTDKAGKTYFAAMPVGYLELPNGKDFTRQLVEIPAKCRRVYAEHYNVFTREKLVNQMTEFVEKTLFG